MGEEISKDVGHGRGKAVVATTPADLVSESPEKDGQSFPSFLSFFRSNFGGFLVPEEQASECQFRFAKAI